MAEYDAEYKVGESPMSKPVIPVAQARAIAQMAIDINPSKVIIKRKLYEDDGLGGSVYTGDVELPPQIMRIFFSSSKFQRKTDEGGAIEKAHFGGLCRYDADVEIDDIFSAGWRKYKVTSVIPVMLAGEIVSKQLELEEVNE